MVRLTVRDGDTLIAEQQTQPPAVYLDHWALRALSEDSKFTKRFVRALKSVHGTLMLSWVNLIEFPRLSDESQARAAEAMIDKTIPNLFFLESNPSTVINNEDRLIAGGLPTAPHDDAAFLRVFVHLKPTSLELFTAHDLFTAAQDPRLCPNIESLAETIIDGIGGYRDRMDSEPEFARRVEGPLVPFHDPRLQRATRYLWAELIRPFLIDRSLKLTRNHALDFLHAVVPLAYCDAVLLDAHWKTQADKVRKRLQNAGVNLPVARTYSGRQGGIRQFLSDLESWDTQHI